MEILQIGMGALALSIALLITAATISIARDNALRRELARSAAMAGDYATASAILKGEKTAVPQPGQKGTERPPVITERQETPPPSRKVL